MARGKENREDPDEYDEYTVWFVGGFFGSSVGEDEIYLPENIPEDAKFLSYERTECDVDSIMSILDYETQIVLHRLRKPYEQWTDADLDW